MLSQQRLVEPLQLMVSINGNKVTEDEPNCDGDEIGLLPPVSGG